jgi:hypothetical protein
MPIYVYETIENNGGPGRRFEVLQRISDPPLETDPKSGRPVRRVITAPNVGGRHGPSSSRDLLSDKNLERTGFTKYEKTGEGSYQRTAGNKGPEKISRG